MTERPKRVLHVVRRMARGGVETWLMHVLRRIDCRRVLMDFLVHTDVPGDFDEEIAEKGCRLIRCLEPVYSPAYAMRVQRLLGENGPYDVVHSHVHHCSGYLTRLARYASVPLRIAHSHNDTARLDRNAGFARRAYLRAMKRWIAKYATRLVGASEAAGRSLFGEEWKHDPRSLVLHYGIDLAPFRKPGDRTTARARWNIGRDEYLIGHVGRFEPQKNHNFLIEIAAEAIRRQPSVRLLLVGDGPQRAAVTERVRQLGIADRVIFAGIRADVPELMAAFDVFLFPSLYEGLGLVALEAQAAGVPCLLSDAVPGEADVVPQLIHRLALVRGKEAWAEAALQAAGLPRPAAAEALATVEKSSFNIRRSVEELYALYAA